MELTITLPDDIARNIAGVHKNITARARRGKQTGILETVCAAILAAMPRLWEIGDDVSLGTGVVYSIDSFCNGGSMAVVASVDRSTWQVFPTAQLIPVELAQVATITA